MGGAVESRFKSKGDLAALVEEHCGNFQVPRNPLSLTALYRRLRSHRLTICNHSLDLKQKPVSL